MTSSSLAAQLRYRFDNVMARGVAAQIGLLAVVTAAIVIVGTIAVYLTRTEHSGGFFPTLWTSLLHVVDNGNISNDGGSKFYIFVMLLVTVAGLTVLAALFGIITNGIDDQLQKLRRGRSRVIEQNHILILGWSPQIFQIVSELLIANENQRGACIVILSERDKPEMEEQLRERVERRGRTRIICRSGNPLDLTDLEIGNLQAARSIIILPPETGALDTFVVKSLLAIAHQPRPQTRPYHIVAPIRDPRNLEVARMAGGEEVVLVLGQQLISRITVQTCRQSGLSVVYTELLDFDGDEIYLQDEPGLIGQTFGAALLAYEDSAIIGLARRDGTICINPPMDSMIEGGDRVIAVSKDDDTVTLSGRTDPEIDITAICHVPEPPAKPEQTLIFNWNSRLIDILTELDSYVAPGSRATVVIREPTRLNGNLPNPNRFSTLGVEVVAGDPTDRATLDSLKIGEYDHVIVLGEADTIDAQEADARTLTTLLHLRGIQERTGAHFSVVSEMVDLRNRELASATRADDFIVSDQLVSLMLSQLSETRELQPVFDQLFNPQGSEIYLKPMERYVRMDQPMTFYTVVEAAKQRNQIAIGYRIVRHSEDADKQYGVVVNPVKSERMTFSTGDSVIVLAED